MHRLYVTTVQCGLTRNCKKDKNNLPNTFAALTRLTKMNPDLPEVL